ncbi:MAG: DUF7933 domain-containing protein [Thermaceae bacterium]
MKHLFLLLSLLTGLAQAQVVTEFKIRYKTNDNGAITLIGNTLMCAQGTGSYGCDTATMNDPRADNYRRMVFVNADPANPSWPSGRGGSSSAILDLPYGSQVLFAGLYWGARAGENAADRNQVYIKPPGSSTYQSITGSLLGTITNQGTSTSRPYAAFADLTELVRASGNGPYWVGGILAATGNDGLGFYAGWSLVVVYKNAAEPFRNLVVYDGYANLRGTNTVTVTPSGFLAPRTGPVNAQVGVVAFEGDGGITGDRLRVNRTDLSDAQNPADNFFNSTISLLGSRFTAKTPDFVNQMAVDADIVKVREGLIPNGATSAEIQFTTSGDAYFPTVLTFQIDLYVPDLNTTFSKTQTDLNGGALLPGDTLEYTISFTNTGQDGATNVVVRDPIPAHTQYVPGSLQVTANADGPTGTFTDASGDDIAEYSPSCQEFDGKPCVRFRLGAGADATSGGLVSPEKGATVKFRVQVLSSAAGQTVTNTARVNYNAQTLGTGFSREASVSANAAVPNPPTIAKAFSPASIPVGGTSTLTITLTNPNDPALGPATLTADLVDTLPAGVVVASPASASTTCPNGTVSATPGENTITLSRGAQIPAGESCKVEVNVTSNTAGTHTNTLSAGALQTDFGSNPSPANATLSVTGVSLSGQVYHDQEPNGVKNGEDWSDGPNVYVKLVQGSSVVAVQTVPSGTGNFSFTGVAPGSYTLIVDDNNATTDTTPTPPLGWLFVNPASGSRSVTVESTDVLGQDFGLFHGGLVEGRVFYDDGEGGGAANDALQNGAERGVGGVAVTATDGTQTRTASTDGSGFYRLYIPASWGNVTLSHPVRPATGWNDGSTPTRVGSFDDAKSPTSSGAVVFLGSGSDLAGRTLYRNFGVVRLSELRPPQSGQATSPGVYTFSHLFRPGSLGRFTLEASGAYTYAVRFDGDCDGSYSSGEVFSSFPLAVDVGGLWPREEDGSLRACGLEVRVLVPSSEPPGRVDVLRLEGNLAWANNTVVSEPLLLLDTLTVAGGEVTLVKQVRNVSQNGPWGSRAEAKPGEVLEYCITYRHLGTAPVSQVVVSDPIPFFARLVLGAYGGGDLLWNNSALTAAQGDDAGYVQGGVVYLEVGALSPGEEGRLCYQVRVE